MCHSIADKGNLKGSLDDGGAHLAAEIRQWLRDPECMTRNTNAECKPAMKIKPLSAGDVNDLVSYPSTLKTK
jgi:hypothetical protein